MINFLSTDFLWTKRVNNLNLKEDLYFIHLTQLFDVMALLCSVLSVFYFQAVQRHTTLVLTTWTLGAMSTSIRPITITAMTSQLVHNISSVTTVGDICIVCTPHKKKTQIFFLRKTMLSYSKHLFNEKRCHNQVLIKTNCKLQRLTYFTFVSYQPSY